MSSFKNASKSNQRTHRERPTPSGARGPLERHKEYRQRADDHYRKERTLKLLRRRALDKNPDEFYHHMINSKIKNGEHYEIEKADEDTLNQIKLMDSQDLKYINMKRTIESKKIKKIQAELHLIDSADSVPNKHTFFVDDEKEMRKFDLVKHLDTHPALLKRRTNRLRLSDLSKINLPNIDKTTIDVLKKQRQKAYRELNKRIEREKELTVIQHKIEVKKQLKDNKVEKPKKIKAGTANSAPVYKWKYQRKR